MIARLATGWARRHCLARLAQRRGLASSEDDWEFVPQRQLVELEIPSRREPQALRRQTGSPLTLAEVEEILAYEGAFDVRTMTVAGTFGDHMVFASAQSSTQLTALALTLVGVLKRRGLGDRRDADGGHAGDDWVCVDCGSIIVQLMLPESRDRLRLEQIWGEGESDWPLAT